MLASVPAAAQQPVFSLTNLIILGVVVAVVYPLQKKLRETVSRRRLERWAEEDRRAELERQKHDADPPSDDEPS